MTLLGVLGGHHRAVADRAGGVQLGRARLSWWAGVGDRWHRPSDEVAIRQLRRRGTPVLDTAWRVAGGDVRAETYGAMVAGREWIVLDLHNATRVPITLALVVQDGRDDVGTGGDGAARGRPSWQLAGPVLHGPGGGGALLVTGRPADAWCEAADPDELLDRLAGGRTVDFDPGAGAAGVSASGGAACVAVVLALTHGSSLRVLAAPDPLPEAAAAGGVARASAAPVDPSRAPAAEAVARGWQQQLGTGCRVDTGDDGATTELTAARAQLLLRPPSGRLDGSADAAALAALGHDREAAMHLDPALAATIGKPLLADDARRLLVAVADVVRWSPDAVTLAEPLLASAVSLAAWAAPGGPAAGARVSGGSNGGDGDVVSWALEAVATRAGAAPPEGIAGRRGRGRGARHTAGEAVSPAWLRRTTAGPDAAVVLQQRATLVDDDTPGALLLLPGFGPAWRGRAVEVHGLPTAAGTLSFALRWHGERPALLWQVDERPGASSVRLRCPAIDPAFSSSERRGEALLAAPATRPDATRPHDTADGLQPPDPGSFR
ncbi:MAG: hypothetical protein AB7W59_27220 [Acidimicrobiia bacterium]